jgi:PP-loop superfamily ATP-utilizing enzyme
MAKDKVCLAYSGGLDTSTILKWLLGKSYSSLSLLPLLIISQKRATMSSASSPMSAKKKTSRPQRRKHSRSVPPR